ncbi:hypothetical protein FJ950_17975 [Mesorhizobium sp. B2-3-14]|nr:hypothetical protein FJ950_17975 [Mesorhizobium sp. B2-3-14]
MPDNLPPRGEIGCCRCFRQFSTAPGREPAPKPPISPLEGEMSGRTEGGAVERGSRTVLALATAP